MRLTNITRVTLPTGRVRHFSVSVGEVVKPAVPISFDQRRHVGEGDRSGSWMALSLRLPAPVDEHLLGEAWMVVLARHGTLRTVFSRDEAGRLQLREHVLQAGRWHTQPLLPGQPTRDAVRAVLDRHCRPFDAPSHRLVLVEPDANAHDPRPALVIAADHSHVDMWSVLLMARDLLNALEALKDGAAAEALVAEAAADQAPDFADHTAALASRGSTPPEVLGRWEEILAVEDGRLPAFPLDLGDVSHLVPEVVEVRDVLDHVQVGTLTAQADAQGVRLLHMVLAEMTAVTLEMAERPLRAVFPVHSRYEPRWHDAVGWFVTNSVIECAASDARSCAADVKRSLQLGQHPLGPVFAPRGGMPHSPGMFAISWLDTRRLPVSLDAELEMQYVSASMSVDGVMIWFVVSASGMHLRCRYPGTPQAARNVRAWMSALVERLQRRTSASCDAEEHHRAS